MAYEKTVWVDHVVERPKTYRVVENADGTVTLVPVTGQILQQGTPLNAENLNKIEEALEQQEQDLNERLKKTGGDMTGDIHMGGNAIQEVKAPEQDSDAANKAYVDAKRLAFAATLGTDWAGTGPYTQTAAVSGILETDTPHVSPVYSDDAALAAAQMEAWSCVSVGKAAAGGIVFTCLDSKPGTEISIQIEVMR